MIFFLNSCQNKEDVISKYNLDQLIVDSNITAESNIFNIVEDLEIVQLKNNENEDFKFSPIKKIIAFEDKMYLKSINDGIYLIKNDGILDEYFFSKGNGPGEYRNLTDFDIKKTTREIYIYDFSKQRFLVYDLRFKYLRTENIGLNFLSFKFIEENIVLFTAKHRNKIDDAFLDFDLFLVDNFFNLKASFIPFDYKKFTQSRLHLDNPFKSFQNSIVFNDLISDTIYQISKNSIKPIKKFKYLKGSIEKNLKSESHRVILDRISNYPDKFNELDFFGHIKGISTKNIIYGFAHGTNQSIYSFKNLDSFKTINYKFPKENSNLDHKNIFDTKAYSQKKFISVVYPHVLEFIKKQYVEKFLKEDDFTKKIDFILQNNGKYGNQVVLKFKVRNF